MTAAFTVRQAREADLDALTELWAASARSSHAFMSDADFDDHHAVMRDYILPSTNILIAVGAAGEDLGFVGSHDDHVDLLYIATFAQGQGVGRFLLSCVNGGEGPRSVQVYADNETGMGFYRSQGFREVRRYAKDAAGHDYPIAHLERDLTARGA